MGEPATVPLQVRLFNQNGKIPKGVYAHPIVVSVADDSPSKPHVTISCHEIYSSYQAFPTIRFDGHGDTIVLTIGSKGLNPIHYTIHTWLPEPKLAGSRIDGEMTFGNDGAIWSSIQPKHFPPTSRPVFGRFSTQGKLENVFRVKSKQFAPGDPQCVVGADSKVWCLGQSTDEHEGIIDRLSSDGAISQLTLPSVGYVAAMATDKNGLTWIAANGSFDGPSYFMTVSSAGVVNSVARVRGLVLDLVPDPHGRGVWFGTATQYGMVTPDGQVTAHRLHTSHGVRFFLGADGKFWVPWVDDCRFVKFDTNGRIVYSGTMKHDAFTPCSATLGEYAFDASKNLYEIDGVQGRVIKITPDGTASSYAMLHDGPPEGIGFHDGKLYVTAQAGIFSVNPSLW